MKARILLFRAIIALFLLNSFSVNAQVQTPRYVSMNPSTGGYYEYLPQGYNPSGSETYPLILFVHGLGETGPGNSTTLPDVLRNGIPKVINSGRFPVSFTVNGKTSKFIVISPQFNVWPKFTDVDAILDYIEAHYKIDRTRIYVTGLSMGGGVTWEYGGCSSNLKYVQRIAGIAPICGASSPSAYRARTIAKYNLPVWAFHNLNDPTVSVDATNQYIAMINEPPAPVPPAKKTIFNASGHDAWTKAYDPAYKENNMNVYEWMLQYSRPAQGTNPPPVVNAGADKTMTLPANSVALSGSATDANGTIASYTWAKMSGPAQFTLSSTTVSNPTLSNLVAGTYIFRLTATDNQSASAYDEVTITVNSATNTPPVANAGADKAITLPTNSVVLSGSGTDANGTIASYAWTKIAGPTQFTLSNVAIANPTVSNLVAGTYTFRLTVKDNGGATASDDVNVVVAPQSVFYTVPGRIEAEQYFQMNGVKSETTKDPSGGGLNIGWIETGDWMDYNVNVTAAASYKVNFRISAPAAGSQLQLKKADGTVLATVTIPATGGYQTWATISTTVSLTAGNQVLRIYSPTSSWNINWFEFITATTPPPTTTKYIKVKIFAGINPYNNAEWNNWNISSSSPAFKYADGTASTVKASLTAPGSVADNGISYVSGIAPAEVLRHSSYSTVQRTLTISGLSASKTYDIELYASRSSNPGNQTLFISSGINQTVSTYNNSTQKAVFTGRTADANGNIVITVNRMNTYNYLNGFTITEKSSTQTSAASRGVTETALGEKETAIDEREAFGTYPNPFVDQVFLKLNNKETGLMNVSVIDQSGRVVKQFQYNKSSELFNQTINLGTLRSGLYMIKVQIGKWSETRKIMRN